MNRERLLALLRADPSHDAAVLSMGEPDYGCEERPDDAPELVWLLLLTEAGTERSMEIPVSAADALGLREGVLCRMEALLSDT